MDVKFRMALGSVIVMSNVFYGTVREEGGVLYGNNRNLS